MKEKIDINAGVAKFRQAQNAILLDVRTREEYAQGHIEGSLNLPVEQLAHGSALLPPDKDTPVYVYCRSGARSGRAEQMLKQMGYGNAQNIGGILDYDGIDKV